MKRAVFTLFFKLFISFLSLGFFLLSGGLRADPAVAPTAAASSKKLELLGLIRTAPLVEVSKTLQSAAFLSDTQGPKVLTLMHLFLGRLGFPEFEVFDADSEVGSFFFKNSEGRLSNLTVLRFNAERLSEDPNLPSLYQGLFGQVRLWAKGFEDYLLVSESQELLDYFSDAVRLKQLQKIMRQQPHRYSIELTAFNSFLVDPIEFFRKSLLQFIDAGRDEEALMQRTDFLAAIIQVLSEEAKSLDAVHLGFNLDEHSTQLGFMAKVNSASDLGVYVKAPVLPSGSCPARYLQAGTLNYTKQWNNHAFALYQDKVLDRLEAYSPASKRYLWSRTASLMHDFNQSAAGACAGALTLHYDRITPELVGGSPGSVRQVLGVVSSQSVYGAAGLQASSTTALFGFLINTLLAEIRDTTQAALRLNAPGALPYVLPSFELKLDSDLYLERPVHVLTSRFYDPRDTEVLLGQTHDYIGVLAQGVVSTQDEEALRPLMKRVKSNQPAEHPVEALFFKNPKKLVDMSFDAQTCLSSLLQESPFLARGPYALSEESRRALLQQLGALKLTPLSMSLEKERSLLDARWVLSTETLRALITFSEDFSKNLFKR